MFFDLPKPVPHFTERDGLRCFSILSSIFIVSTQEETSYDAPRLFILEHLPPAIPLYPLCNVTQHSALRVSSYTRYRKLTNATTSTTCNHLQLYNLTQHRASTTIRRRTDTTNSTQRKPYLPTHHQLSQPPASTPKPRAPSTRVHRHNQLRCSSGQARRSRPRHKPDM